MYRCSEQFASAGAAERQTPPHEEERERGRGQRRGDQPSRGAAALLGAAVAVLLASVLLPLAGDPVARADVTSTQVAGRIFGTWVWPFELLSLLLLLALVAALAVSRIPREAAP